MAREPQIECVVFGAGALGLGFLGPELTRDCRVTFIDVPARADLVAHLHERGRYVFNETGLSVRPVEVCGVDAALTSDTGAVARALHSADLLITAVGEPNLPKLAPLLAVAALRRRPGAPLRVLCAENGVEIARGLRSAVEKAARGELPGLFVAGDAVMGRMCKIVGQPQPPVQPVRPGADWAIVAEPFFGIPTQQHVVEGMDAVPAALAPLGPDRFSAAEDVKMLSHNGLHAVLACLGNLRGADHFDELRADGELMDLARRLLVDEAGRALEARHGAALDRNEYLNYCDSILRRITCPVLHDSIARGVRGMMRKLEPNERLVYSVRTVAAQGLVPAAYARGLAAAVATARRNGETSLGLREVLTAHCGFDPDQDGGLIELVERAPEAARA